MHARSPAHAQLGSPAHSAGIGSHTFFDGLPWYATHIVPIGHVAQSGTASHASAGTHAPDQQAPLIPGSVPGGQSGGSESHATSPLHCNRSVAHWPKRQTAILMPIASHIGWSHARSHSGSIEPTGSPKQLQQSLWSWQSASTWHAPPPIPPVVELPPLDEPSPVVPVSAAPLLPVTGSPLVEPVEPVVPVALMPVVGEPVVSPVDPVVPVEPVDPVAVPVVPVLEAVSPPPPGQPAASERRKNPWREAL